MAGTGGKRAGAGRPKGAQNKVTTDLKAAILGAYDASGGQKYLEAVARDDPKTFCTLLGKILPTQVTGDPDNPLEIIQRQIVDPSNPDR